MKEKIKQIDKWFLGVLTQYVRKWIKKNNFEKHKVDFEIRLTELKIVLTFTLAAILPAVFYAAEGHIFSASWHFTVWSMMTGIYVLKLGRKIAEEKPRHDILFSLRKNPQVYQMEKEVLEEVFETMRHRRLPFIFFDFAISWFFCSMWVLFFYFTPLSTSLPTLFVAVYFFVTPFINAIDMYMIFVFDFDEPDEKKKVAKESISKIFLRAWQNLIGGLAPQPNFG